MGMMETMMTTGLDVEFEAHIADYFVIDDDDKKQALRELVDSNGLKDPMVMKHIGVLQREKVLRPGIYKEFMGLQAKIDAANGSGGNGASAAAADPPAATTSPAPAEVPAPAAPAAAPTTPASEAAAPAAPKDKAPELTEEQIASYQFSQEQEEAIKKKLAAEEEKMRKRMLSREQKIREQMILGRQKRATRIGLKAEDAAKIEAARAQIKQNNEQIAKLREANKAQKSIIEALRPRRRRSAVSENSMRLRIARRKLTMASKSGDAAAIAEAEANVVKYQALVAKETVATGSAA